MENINDIKSEILQEIDNSIAKATNDFKTLIFHKIPYHPELRDFIDFVSAVQGTILDANLDQAFEKALPDDAKIHKNFTNFKIDTIKDELYKRFNELIVRAVIEKAKATYGDFNEKIVRPSLPIFQTDNKFSLVQKKINEAIKGIKKILKKGA